MPRPAKALAKLKFDVCLLKENGKAKHKVKALTRHGFEQLIGWLDSHQFSNLTWAKTGNVQAASSEEPF